MNRTARLLLATLLLAAATFTALLSPSHREVARPATSECWLHAAVTAQQGENIQLACRTNQLFTAPSMPEQVQLGEMVWLKLETAPQQDALLEVSQAVSCNTTDNTRASILIASMSDERLLSQLLLARVPGSKQLSWAESLQLGGYLLFYRDIQGETAASLTAEIASWQQVSSIPMLIGVDEEGGTVVRVSLNKNLRSSRFKSPQSLYNSGGMAAVLADTVEKNALLLSLGFNFNLAPVADMANDRTAFIYERTLGQNPQITSEYISAVVKQMCEDKIGCALKHFPGYGENVDTHYTASSDYRDIEHLLENDLKPFIAGIEAGARCILVSHNTVNALDPNAPASLSAAVHDFLRTELNYDWVIMTDDIQMGAIYAFSGDKDPAVLAVLAGNDLICCSDFPQHIEALRDALADGTLTRERVEQSVRRLLLWKMELEIF